MVAFLRFEDFEDLFGFVFGWVSHLEGGRGEETERERLRRGIWGTWFRAQPLGSHITRRSPFPPPLFQVSWPPLQRRRHNSSKRHHNLPPRRRFLPALYHIYHPRCQPPESNLVPRTKYTYVINMPRSVFHCFSCNFCKCSL